eukprot:scaffold168297_cov22-Tisochrysis_lutea.AAC.1
MVGLDGRMSVMIEQEHLHLAVTGSKKESCFQKELQPIVRVLLALEHKEKAATLQGAVQGMQ